MNFYFVINIIAEIIEFFSGHFYFGKDNILLSSFFWHVFRYGIHSKTVMKLIKLHKYNNFNEYFIIIIETVKLSKSINNIIIILYYTIGT